MLRFSHIVYLCSGFKVLGKNVTYSALKTGAYEIFFTSVSYSLFCSNNAYFYLWCVLAAILVSFLI